MIQSFTDGAFRVLKPGGRLIGINTNPFLSTRSDFEASHQYSVKYTTDKETCEEGDPLHIHIIGDGWEAKFDNYYWKPETYEKAFLSSGFSRFRWVPLEVTSDEDGYWAEWLKKTPLICFEAIKSTGESWNSNYQMMLTKIPITKQQIFSFYNH